MPKFVQFTQSGGEACRIICQHLRNCPQPAVVSNGQLQFFTGSQRVPLPQLYERCNSIIKAAIAMSKGLAVRDISNAVDRCQTEDYFVLSHCGLIRLLSSGLCLLPVNDYTHVFRAVFL